MYLICFVFISVVVYLLSINQMVTQEISFGELYLGKQVRPLRKSGVAKLMKSYAERGVLAQYMLTGL